MTCYYAVRGLMVYLAVILCIGKLGDFFVRVDFLNAGSYRLTVRKCMS